jgi:hypothetical protein
VPRLVPWRAPQRERLAEPVLEPERAARMDHRWPERLAEQVRVPADWELAREQRGHPKVRALPAEQARAVRARLARREQVQVRPARLVPEPLARAARV